MQFCFWSPEQKFRPPTTTSSQLRAWPVGDGVTHLLTGGPCQQFGGEVIPEGGSTLLGVLSFLPATPKSILSVSPVRRSWGQWMDPLCVKGPQAWALNGLSRSHHFSHGCTYNTHNSSFMSAIVLRLGSLRAAVLNDRVPSLPSGGA